MRWPKLPGSWAGPNARSSAFSRRRASAWRTCWLREGTAMTAALSRVSGMNLDDIIEAYEAAQRRDGDAPLEQFLTPPDHPLYPEVLRELVRVDLEFGWERGTPRPLA